MKKFILMLIACLVLSSSIVYGASVIKSAYFNEGLTLAVNNSQADVRFVTVELEGEQYGRNYVSVADFVKALNDYAGLNATVDFDSKTQTIIVDTKVSTPTAINVPTAAVQTKTVVENIPEPPSEVLPEGMEWVLYGEGNNRDWAIKYNNCIYYNEFLISRFGYRITHKPSIRENGLPYGMIVITKGEEFIPYDDNDANYAIRANHGIYTNITWLAEHFQTN
jgi:hypothetical protein